MLRACRCGAKKSQIVRPLNNGYTCYCNSCGRNESEAYGKTEMEAMNNWNNRQEVKHGQK